MRVYLVGGAVRDDVLGRAVSERDWVVVGSSPEEMERLDTAPSVAISRSFCIRRTHEEYALARRERKVGPGYPRLHDPVLARRHARAGPAAPRSDDQRDRARYRRPAHRSLRGQHDLAARSLRHVSEAFVEDPVRILRVARFAARFTELGFAVAPETQALMRHMVDNGEVRSLVPERLWRELARALGEPSPDACFDSLQQCGALAVLLPELHWDERARRALCTAVAPEPRRERALRGAARRLRGQRDRVAVRAAAHPDGVSRAGAAQRALGRRGCPTRVDGSPAALLALLETADAYRRAGRFDLLLLAAEATVTDEAPPSDSPHATVHTVRTVPRFACARHCGRAPA